MRALSAVIVLSGVAALLALGAWAVVNDPWRTGFVFAVVTGGCVLAVLQHAFPGVRGWSVRLGDGTCSTRSRRSP